MAQVQLSIGDRTHTVACRDGEQARVADLGRLLDERWPAALRAAGGVNTERAMFFVALMLADALDESQNRPSEGSAPEPGMSEGMLARIADRLESLADALEQSSTSA
ncbi:MAG: cell division protein ZapA [Sphingomonas bacterium]|uniref:cell division protein ZapA n=1 Tax=Sphingomonas bacterium TaxID=1895847 RepID=UPI002614D7EC|nr:cell division protein ZapA [Sphingomonas bacterium]MDB5695954.1 cell division protein ZapA [Sphingomonas bacterium]